MAKKLQTSTTEPERPNLGTQSETPTKGETDSGRHQWIADAAYLKSKARCFEPGHEEEDWLEAEKEYEKLHAGDAQTDLQ